MIKEMNWDDITTSEMLNGEIERLRDEYARGDLGDDDCERLRCLSAVHERYAALTSVESGRCCLCGGAFEFPTTVTTTPVGDVSLVNYDLDLWACDDCIEGASVDLVDFLRNITE